VKTAENEKTVAQERRVLAPGKRTTKEEKTAKTSFSAPSSRAGKAEKRVDISKKV